MLTYHKIASSWAVQLITIVQLLTCKDGLFYLIILREYILQTWVLKTEFQRVSLVHSDWRSKDDIDNSAETL